MYQNVYVPLQHLKKTPVNTGGLCWAVFVRKQDVIQWPAMHPATNLAFTAIKLRDGATWYRLQIVDKDRYFIENQKDSAAGPYTEMELSGYFGGNSVAHILTFNSLAFEEMVVMFKDRDGSIRFIGNEDKGAIFRSSYNSGDYSTSRKRAIKISWEHPLSAPIYIGSLENIANDIIEPPFAGQGDFSEDFSEDFNI